MCVTFFISSPANRRSIAEKRGRLNGSAVTGCRPAPNIWAAYAGFYIDSETVYQANMDSGWNRLLDGLCQKLTNYESSFQKRCAWTNKQAGRNRFVILKNKEVEIIAEDDDEYVAVFVIIPEDCRNPEEIKQIFPRYVPCCRIGLGRDVPGPYSQKN